MFYRQSYLTKQGVSDTPHVARLICLRGPRHHKNSFFYLLLQRFSTFLDLRQPFLVGQQFCYTHSYNLLVIRGQVDKWVALTPSALQGTIWWSLGAPATQLRTTVLQYKWPTETFLLYVRATSFFVNPIDLSLRPYLFSVEKMK